jgi:kynureninase
MTSGTPGTPAAARAARDALTRARALDASDPLAGARGRFVSPAPGRLDADEQERRPVYLAGHSLGPAAKGVLERVARTVDDEWGVRLARAWSECDWIDAPVRLGDRIARLIGARAGEVVVTDTTSIGLAKLVGAALAARPDRRVVVTTSDNFPSDIYAASGAARLAGAELRVVDRRRLEPVLADLEGRVALCCVTQVDFRTGALYDVARVTRAAHEVGALMLWDLCHSAGVVPVGCEAHGVDLAVGCTYKYLNGGPGSPAFLYVRHALQDELENPLPGWLGHDSPFSFTLDWRPAGGIRRFLTSTPPVVALAALDASLDAFDGVTIDALREKSKALGELFVEIIESADVPDLHLASPRAADDRGSQVSLSHPRASEIVSQAAVCGVVGDVRPPDICRFGLSPLALSHEDVALGAITVAEVARGLPQRNG